MHHTQRFCSNMAPGPVSELGAEPRAGRVGHAEHRWSLEAMVSARIGTDPATGPPPHTASTPR